MEFCFKKEAALLLVFQMILVRGCRCSFEMPFKGRLRRLAKGILGQRSKQIKVAL